MNETFQSGVRRSTSIAANFGHTPQRTAIFLLSIKRFRMADSTSCCNAASSSDFRLLGQETIVTVLCLFLPSTSLPWLTGGLNVLAAVVPLLADLNYSII